VAERFAYVPMLGIFFMIASGINYIWQKYQYKFITYSLIITITTVVACLSVMTWKQCKIWENTLTLWNHAVNINPEYPSGTALFFRAGAYHRAGELDKALADYNVLIGRIKNAAGTEIDENAKYHDQKNLVRILSARGSLYYQNGNLSKAAEDYTSILEILDVNPIKKAEVFYKRAVVYYSMKQNDKAVSDILKVIDITPYNDRLYEFIGIIRASQKDYKTACKYFEKALSINPANKSSYYYLEQINKIKITN
jgi:tetratricopeptide (TPR) repeat protein